jgi:hypothetical protein
MSEGDAPVAIPVLLCYLEVAAISRRQNAGIRDPSHCGISSLNSERLGLRQLPSTIKSFGCDYDLGHAPRRVPSTTLL